jgi:hypothetical protein
MNVIQDCIAQLLHKQRPQQIEDMNSAFQSKPSHLQLAHSSFRISCIDDVGTSNHKQLQMHSVNAIFESFVPMTGTSQVFFRLGTYHFLPQMDRCLSVVQFVQDRHQVSSSQSENLFRILFFLIR